MAGIQNDEIITLLDLENTLKCPVCFELRDGHIYSCNSGHHLCRACRESLRFCPLCQSGLSFSRNFVVETLTSRYEFVKEAIDFGQTTESLESGQTPESQENGQTPENQESIFDFSVSDFATIMKTTAFVDKTLMIRDIFNSSSQILITAPPRFGKSTNLNMIKRFVEIELDEYDRPIHHSATHTTENYILFKDNNLAICNYDEFFNEHFGRYPVLYTDWKALGRVSDFASMIDVFRRIIVETFSLHIRLLDKFINQLKKDDFDIIHFKKYFSEQSIKDMDMHDLVCGFKHLSRLLYRHFKKKVFVLIDNCDAFINGMLFSKNTSMAGKHKTKILKDTFWTWPSPFEEEEFNKNSNDDKIISFINTVIDHLLQNNHCVGRAVLTGVLPLTGEGFALHGSNIDCYSFLDNHLFCKYYGLTSDELDKVLYKLEKDSQKRIQMKRMINEYYNCYTAENQNIQVYSIWSVLQYLRKRKVQSSWCSHECISIMKAALCNHLIQNKAEQLLCGNLLQLDILRPLSTTDVLQLNFDSRMDRVFLLFYHIGCLSVNRVFGRGFVDLKIPNEEIKYELAKLLLEANYRQEFVENMKQVWSAIESFQPDTTDQNNLFKTFVETLQVLSRCRWVELASPHCYLTGLFVGLLTISKCRQTVAHRLGPDGLMVILLKNKHNVVICITAEEDTSLNYTDETRRKTAENAYKNITDNSYEDQVFGMYDNLCGKVLIAIGYRLSSADFNGINYDVSIAYSHNSISGDNLQNYRTL